MSQCRSSDRAREDDLIAGYLLTEAADRDAAGTAFQAMVEGARAQRRCVGLKHFHKYCDVVRVGYVQAFFGGTPA